MHFGIETDFRTRNGEIIVSHDPPIRSADFAFEDVLALKTSLALNIKEDGLSDEFAKNAERLDSYSFFFDGSIPEMLKYRNRGLPHALRLSEYEPNLPWKTPYVWLDSFISNWWIGNNQILDLLESGVKVVVVSPELHGRDYHEAWDEVYRLINLGYSGLGICTDNPMEFVSTFIPVNS